MGLQLTTLESPVRVPPEPLGIVKMEDMSSAISYSLPAMKDRNRIESTNKIVKKHNIHISAMSVIFMSSPLNIGCLQLFSNEN